MNNKLTATIAALLLSAVVLTGCSNTEPAPTPEPAPVETVTPTPTETPTPEETLVPAEEFTGSIVEEKVDGQWVLPNGEIADCADTTTAIMVGEDGTYTCQDGSVEW